MYNGTQYLQPIQGVEDIVNRVITKFETFEKSNIPVIPVDCQTITDHLLNDERYPNIKLQTQYIGNGLDLA